MKNAIIVHGTCDKEEYYSPEYPSGSNSHWLPWLQKQFLIKDIPVATPEIPHAYMPDYAPWLDPNKTKGESNDFFNFVFDSELVSRTQGVTIFNSDDDEDAMHTSVKQIMEAVPNIKLVEFREKGHFCLSDLGTEAFPELLEEVLK